MNLIQLSGGRQQRIALARMFLKIPHSISQITGSEMVHALQDGRVEQSGNPDELYRKGGVCKEIVDASARSLNLDKSPAT